MARKKSSSPKVPKPKPINKKLLVERLVEIPKSGIREWIMREYVCLKRLEAKYPLEFLNIIDFGKKLPSLLVLDSDWGRAELERKYHAFTYKPVEKEQIVIDETKYGEDIKVEKKKTLRDLI